MFEIPITLGEAYYNRGFINIPIEYDLFFGHHNTPIVTYLGGWGLNAINGIINRMDNPNYSPRIRMGINYTHWIHANHNIGDIILVSFNNPTHPNSILIQ